MYKSYIHRKDNEKIYTFGKFCGDIMRIVDVIQLFALALFLTRNVKIAKFQVYAKRNVT